MKVNFLIPPVLVGSKEAERVAGCSYSLYPTPNILVLLAASVIRDSGFEVSYNDCALKHINKAGLEDFLKSDNSDIYCLFTVNLAMESDLKARDIIREVKPHAAVVFFGPTPTYWPGKFLKDSHTYVVRGEPEYTLKELTMSIKDKTDTAAINGVSWLKGGQVAHNPSRELINNLDALPFPARDLIDRYKNKYFYPKLRTRPVTLVLASRNCPYRCTYCVPCSLSFAVELEYKKYFGKKPPVRLRSAQNVIAEFKLLKGQGYRAVEFLDDNFVWGEQRTTEICRGIKNSGIIWGCQSRADLLTEPIVKEMAVSNCRYVDIGVESFDQNILDDVKKDITVEDSIRAIELLKKYGIDAKINIIFGASHLETKETIDKTVNMVNKLNVSQVMYSVCAPWPGTQTYDIAKKEGWFVYGDYKISDGDRDAIIQFPHLSKQVLEQTVRRANLEFFLNPRFIFSNIKKIGLFNLRDLIGGAKAVFNKIK